uniref:(northern house mosquito) hypothetical protein n=1 Tax=Culex pipiens TaxID=7175 RepID=A0A8D8H5B0_CULPI
MLSTGLRKSNCRNKRTRCKTCSKIFKGRIVLIKVALTMNYHCSLSNAVWKRRVPYCHRFFICFIEFIPSSLISLWNCLFHFGHCCVANVIAVFQRSLRSKSRSARDFFFAPLCLGITGHW